MYDTDTCDILWDTNDCVNADALKFAFWSKSTSAQKINNKANTLNLVKAFSKKKTLNISSL